MNDTVSRVGSRFGPYQLKRLLGRGGMGEVYEAEDTRKHRIVALKLISQDFSTNSMFRARMQREADTAGRLTEAHIVPIHDYGDIDGQFYVEMRMIDGVSLRSILMNYGPLSPARTVAIVTQIAAALDAAHAGGVTHRDVKPENILVTKDDFAYLVDFGIARAATDPGLTQSGIAMGTYNYMAPERFTGDEVTYRSDIYALACVLDECLTGAPPYRADSVERLIAAHLLEPVPRPSQLRPGRSADPGPGHRQRHGQRSGRPLLLRRRSGRGRAQRAHRARAAQGHDSAARRERDDDGQRRLPRPRVDQLQRFGHQRDHGSAGVWGAGGDGWRHTGPPGPPGVWSTVRHAPAELRARWARWVPYGSETQAVDHRRCPPRCWSSPPSLPPDT